MTDPDPDIGWAYGTPLYTIVEYFYDDESIDEEMSLPEMDGFMTALAVGPTRPAPELWIRKILISIDFDGRKQPWFRDETHRNAIHTAFITRMAELDSAFAGRFEDYRPVVSWRPESDAVRVEQWAQGFLDGIRFVEWPWLPMLESFRGRTILRPAVECEELGDEWFDEDREGHPVLPPPYAGAEGVETLRTLAWETALWWRNHREDNVVSLH